jgi:hypothetical protein
MLVIVALARLAHIGPATRSERDKRPAPEHIICRATGDLAQDKVVDRALPADET